MRKHIFDLPIRVLLYTEDEAMVAHGLEMDLLAYGETEQDALESLKGSIASQISFAAFKETPEMVYFPAEKELFERWERANEAQLRGLAAPDKSETMGVKAVAICIPAKTASRTRKATKARKNWDPVRA